MEAFSKNYLKKDRLEYEDEYDKDVKSSLFMKPRCDAENQKDWGQILCWVRHQIVRNEIHR